MAYIICYLLARPKAKNGHTTAIIVVKYLSGARTQSGIIHLRGLFCTDPPTACRGLEAQCLRLQLASFMACNYLRLISSATTAQ
jgi:hypothetical protein